MNLINHIEVRDIRPNGAMKALVRLGGVITGTFRKTVSQKGHVALYLPGGTKYETPEGEWKIWEPLTVLYKGRFVNRELKAELYRLAGVWWMRHKNGEPDEKFQAKDIARTSFADRHWTEPVELLVRPRSYVPLDEAEKANRVWDAGRAEVVIRKGDFDLIASIPIRRRAYGIEAAMPLWSITKIEEDYLGRPVETKEFVPRFHFQAGGGYIDGQVLGAVTLLWAWHFKVTEPLVNRRGRCVGCRFLEYKPDDRPLTEKEDPVGRRYWCSLRGFYVDDVAAKRNARLYMQGMERLASIEAGLARFYTGCDEWVSRDTRLDLKTLTFSHSEKEHTADGLLTETGTLKRHLFEVKEPTIRFTAAGYTNSEHPDTEVPATPVLVRPLLEGAGDLNGRPTVQDNGSTRQE